jgi:hypothetical protein
MSYDRKRSHRELKSPMLLSTPLDDTDPSCRTGARIQIEDVETANAGAEGLDDAIIVREFGEALGSKGPDAP